MTASEFKAIFPAFVATNDDTVSAAIALAAPWFNVDRWGRFYSEGLANWVAHKLTVDAPSNAGANNGGGDATDKQVGSVRISRGETLLKAQMDDPFMRTAYGQRYRYLAGLAGMGAVVAAC